MKADLHPPTRIVYCGDGDLFVLFGSPLPPREAVAQINQGLLRLPFAAPDASLRAVRLGGVVVVTHPDGIQHRQVRLTPREGEVLAAVSQGCSLAEVARRLGLRRSTVCTYTASLKVKLAARNLPSLVSHAAERGLLG